MMTISDIFDALTAKDRPYKKAIPNEKALAIIESEVKQGLLDAELFRVFCEAKVWEIVRPDGTPVRRRAGTMSDSHGHG
jgi:HD-GYP domain-containing protein (c-di-GMP phosphodiesterase class II)